MTSDLDATAPKYLRGKYAIVGIGETGYTRGSGMTTRALGTRAVRATRSTDAGPQAFDDVDGMLSYSGNDSMPSTSIAGDLGMRLNFYMDCQGGGSSTEALVGIAMGVIEAGLCNTVAIFRAMNGYSRVPHRRHRALQRSFRALRRRPVRARLWPGQRRPELRPQLHAPHVRLRHHPRASGAREGDPLRARLQQPQGVLQEPRDGR